MTDVLSQRGLGRATLARQYLLERAPARAIDAIGHLGGMQSQAPLAPYVGLWTRLQDFAPEELTALTDQRQVARLNLMRNTVHLVSARDCLDWRALFYPLHAAEFSAHFRHGTKGVDRDALPQVYLHYDPYVRSQLGVQPGQLKRQRMDFLLLLPRRARSGLGDASSARLHRGPPLRAALRRARPPCLRGGR